MTDYQTKQKRRNTIVGLFVICALIAFVGFLWRFRELPLFVSRLKSYQVSVYFPEAPGVQKDTPVKYCGYQIGRVLEVTPPHLREGGHKVGVRMAIYKKYADIPEQVDFHVMKRGLGSSYIDISLDPMKITDPLNFLDNNTVKEDGQVSMASDFFPPDMQAALPHLVDAITNLTENINVVIGDTDNQANIKCMLTNFEVASAQLETTLRSVERLSNVGTDTIEVLGDNVSLITEQVEQTLSQTRQLLAKIDSGTGTAGKLVNDGRLYENLLESSEELQMLLDQLKQWADQAREEGVKVKTKIL